MIIPLEFRKLGSDELKRVYDIDRYEVVQTRYRRVGDQLKCFEEESEIASDPAFWDQRLPVWQRELEADAVAFGAFDGDRMCGFALLKNGARKDLSQILALYVSIDYRMRGVAKSLFMEMESAAKGAKAKSLFVLSPPTGPSVGFYLSQGFAIPSDPKPFPKSKDPSEIAMIKALR
ncbi:GNAT family N-acetyltransferase [Pelagicoccus sp. SDUM812003]|uniref:GNAT family N-acetyltransferase n=1 Tax=Pelagicoccus sp. SDUM812003 TaxID=3041267 RepID=UPI00280DE017|nr:GNAT family N-acetyltransferase [Pelagicoccus sp. SDUM812003]MDQ8204534.1 GNAT family N-acetyltransferase [Pelagicoccus sp. SDUM812003]